VSGEVLGVLCSFPFDQLPPYYSFGTIEEERRPLFVVRIFFPKEAYPISTFLERFTSFNLLIPSLLKKL